LKEMSRERPVVAKVFFARNDDRSKSAGGCRKVVNPKRLEAADREKRTPDEWRRLNNDSFAVSSSNLLPRRLKSFSGRCALRHERTPKPLIQRTESVPVARSRAIRASSSRTPKGFGNIV